MATPGAVIRRYGDLLVRFPGTGAIRRRVLGLTAAALAGELVFRGLDWTWAQQAVQALVIGVAQATGTGASAGGVGDYVYGGHPYEMTARCTYVDFLCLTTPLVVRMRSVREDALRLGAWWTVVLVLGALRIAAACELMAAGWPWVLAHTAPDHILRSVVLIVVIYRFLEAWLPDEGSA